MEHCCLCREKANLCDSHVISNFAIKAARGEGGDAKLLEITSKEHPRVARDQRRNREHLLCRGCEEKRLEWEAIVAATLIGSGDGREQRPNFLLNRNGRELRCENLRYGPIKLWVLSTIYLMHCTRSEIPSCSLSS